MMQAAEELSVSPMVIRRLIASKRLPARQIIKHAPWGIERKDLDLPAVRKAIWVVHEGLRSSGNSIDDRQEALFDCGEVG
jgi:predicted RNA methylase